MYIILYWTLLFNSFLTPSECIRWNCIYSKIEGVVIMWCMLFTIVFGWRGMKGWDLGGDGKGPLHLLSQLLPSINGGFGEGFIIWKPIYLKVSPDRLYQHSTCKIHIKCLL